MSFRTFVENQNSQDIDMPDIFDGLAGGEDTRTVKILLGFGSDDPTRSTIQGDMKVSSMSKSSNGTMRLKASRPPDCDEPYNPDKSKEGKARKRDPVDPAKCTFICQSCSKAFTTKFNLKRHMNLHCGKSKEAGVPIQGPPSANKPSKKLKEADSTSSLGSSPKRTIKTKRKRKTSMSRSNNPDSVQSSNIPESVFSSLSCDGSNESVDASNLYTPSVTTSTFHHPDTRFSRFQVGQIPTSYSNYSVSCSTETGMPMAMSTCDFNQQSHQEDDFAQHQLPHARYQILSQEVHSQQNPFYQPRFVQVVNPINGHQSTQQATATIVGQLRPGSTTVPVQYHDEGGTQVFQAFPVSIVKSGTKSVITRAMQVPQQPLHMVHSTLSQSPSSTSQFESGSQLGGDFTQKQVFLYSTQMDSMPKEEFVTTSDDRVVVKVEEDDPLHDLSSGRLVSSGFDVDDNYYDHCRSEFQEPWKNPSEEAPLEEMGHVLNNVSRSLTEVPKDWIRKQVITQSGDERVFYYNSKAKRFSNIQEVLEYFQKRGQTVRPELFNFHPTKQN